MSVKRIVFLFGIIVGISSIVGAAERQPVRQDCKPYQSFGGNTNWETMDNINKAYPKDYSKLNVKHDYGKGIGGNTNWEVMDSINRLYPKDFVALNVKHDYNKGFGGNTNWENLDSINKLYPPQYPCRY